MYRCPYFYGYYRWNDDYRDDFYPNIQPMDPMTDFELINEEEDYYDEMMRQPQEINEIMNRINTRLGYLFTELARYRMNRNTARYLFRVIASYVINNASRFTGTLEQRTGAMLADFRRRHPWVFFIMRSFGIPARRVEEIVRTVIAFVLSVLGAIPAPPEDIEQRADRIVNLIRSQTDVFRDLRRFDIPENRIVALVRRVVVFTLRNSNINQPPVNIQDRADELLRQFERTNADIINDMKRFGIPDQQIRVILRTIILFTLRNIYMREEE